MLQPFLLKAKELENVNSNFRRQTLSIWIQYGGVIRFRFAAVPLVTAIGTFQEAIADARGRQTLA